MSTVCGWASQSEKKTANGKKGDQTKREVRIGNYYDFGQNEVIRFKNPARAKKAAQAMISICGNDNIGYGQNDRTSLFTECKKIGWNIKKIHKIGLCNTDCSETVACAINFAYGKEVIPASTTTGVMHSNTVKKHSVNFKAVNKFNVKNVKVGDIVLKAGHHVIMVVSK